MTTGVDFKSGEFDPLASGSNCKDLKFSPVRLRGFGITSKISDGLRIIILRTLYYMRISLSSTNVKYKGFSKSAII